MDDKSEKNRMIIDLRIVEPTRLNSKWSLNARFGSISSNGRYIDILSKQFLRIYYFICLMRVLVALFLRQNI